MVGLVPVEEQLVEKSPISKRGASSTGGVTKVGDPESNPAVSVW